MADSKTYYGRSTYRYLSTERQGPGHSHSPGTGTVSTDSMFELDESDVWNVAVSVSVTSPPSSRISSKKKLSPSVVITPSSLPVNVPDWSKILKEEYSRRRVNDDLDDSDGDDDNERRIPPHEFVARSRIASFSVHEGIGRTLKGRDLSRVRNAIWAKTGFQD